MFSADPDKDFLEHDRIAETRLSRLPVCSVCGEHITDESALLIWEEWICDKCVLANRAQVDDYVETDEDIETRWEE